ncbi:MAG: GAF domain-containing protein [Aphanothece sp. CMT-3BRIN-NPC111]|jgi:GAF domain-containing protein|nr:GAF domain-containing protein [Aphanothece sp. CMT-3BRIN-NPC111]
MGQQEIKTTYEKQLVALEDVLQTLREEENVDVLIQTTLNYLKAEFNYRLIWIGFYDRLKHRLLGKGGVTPSGNIKLLKQKFLLNSGELLEQVVLQQRSVAVSDLGEEVRAGEWRRAAQEFGVKGTLLYPLRCKDQCFGVALLGSHLWGITPRASEKAQMSLLFGGLAAALYQSEVNSQHSQHSSSKRPDQSLFQLLEQLQKLGDIEKRLEAVVNTTQEVVTPVRTYLYWYSAGQRNFWQRIANQQKVRGLRNSQNTAPSLAVSEVGDFYLNLAAGKLVTIGAGKSPLKVEVTRRLMQQLQARSLLAVPVLAKGELLGFLGLEGKEARIWEEEEENYARAAAQVVALVAGSEDMEARLQQTQQDANFITEIASALANEAEPKAALKKCADLLLKRFSAISFLVLQKDNVGSRKYTILYQQQPVKGNPLNAPFDALNSADRKLLEESSEAVAIEDWEKDQRLGEWRKSLMPLGVRSLLVCRTGTAKTAALLLICYGTPRTWNQTERQLVGIVSQQIGLLSHSASLGSQLTQMEQLNWYKHRCLETLSHTVTSSVSALQQVDSQSQRQPSSSQPLGDMRSSQILHQLENTLASLSPVLNEEQWQLQTRLIAVNLESLLKRSLRRLQPLYKQRQILAIIHNSANLNVLADRLKLECILFEVLVTSCYHAQPKSRVDIWCNLVEQEASGKGQKKKEELSPLVELLITENEVTNSNTDEFYTKAKAIVSNSSPVQPPSLNFKVCQRILRSWDGDLVFYKLENRRLLSRLILSSDRQ